MSEVANKVKEIIVEKLGVEAGENMYKTMEYYGNIFPVIYVNMIKVGDKIRTYILKFNPADKRIALSVHEQSVVPAEEAPVEE